MTPSHVAALLLAWRGRHGKLKQLNELYTRRDALEDDPVSSPPGISEGHGGGGISDPVAVDALEYIHNTTKLDSKIDLLEQEYSDICSALRQCPHGEWIQAYYLTTQDDITWIGLSADAGVDNRTMLRWRADGLQWMADHLEMWMMI